MSSKVERVFENMASLTEALEECARLVRKSFKEHFEKAKGSSGKTMRKLTPRYRKYKKAVTGRTKRDLNFTGDMLRGLVQSRQGKNEVHVHFTPQEAKKALRNYNLDNRMWDNVDEKTRDACVAIVHKHLMKGV